MTYRLVRLLAVGAAIAVLGLLGSVPGASAQGVDATSRAQTPATWTLEQHQELARRLAAHIRVPKDWTPARTPWGHPDFAGAWTSDGVHGIPRERPAEIGTRMFLTGTELAERAKREAQTRQTAANASGAQTGGRDRAWRGDITFPLTSLIVAPAGGRMPPVTPEAQQRRASRDRGSFGEGPFNTFEDFTLYDRCITRGVVGSVLPVPYGNGNRIVQTPDSFVISYEMIHDTRVVPLDGRAHVPTGIRQYLGDSRGRWEGDTLVVETTNFTDQTSIGGNGNGLRHSSEMRLTERFTLVADNVLMYDITIDDPKTYAQPWTIAVPLISPDGFQPLPYDCHEGNGAIKYIMSAERAEDEAIEADRKRGIVRARRPVQGDINTLPDN
jgi:hypothetical protein